jgi:hypothetical protein
MICLRSSEFIRSVSFKTNNSKTNSQRKAAKEPQSPQKNSFLARLDMFFIAVWRRGSRPRRGTFRLLLLEEQSNPYQRACHRP